jgi:hypothetical protein
VYYKCVKFHKNPISGLGGVALTRYMDRRTDRVIPIYPPNFVCGGYNKNSRLYTKLYTVVVHYLQMCMKKYGRCPNFGRGDDLTYTLKYILYGEMGM